MVMIDPLNLLDSRLIKCFTQAVRKTKAPEGWRTPGRFATAVRRLHGHQLSRADEFSNSNILVPPFQGFHFLDAYPGRCPGLACLAPVGLSCGEECLRTSIRLRWKADLFEEHGVATSCRENKRSIAWVKAMGGLHLGEGWRKWGFARTSILTASRRHALRFVQNQDLVFTCFPTALVFCGLPCPIGSGVRAAVGGGGE
jgi:hypothetical protein